METKKIKIENNKELFEEASKHFYGVQNKYTDKMDFFNKQEEELNNNLTYFNTYSADYETVINNCKYDYKSVYSNNSKKFTLSNLCTDITIDTDFIKNIKIKNLSSEYVFSLLIGNQIIYKLYSDIYNVVVKKFQISDIDKDFVVIPMNNIVYPRHHSVKIQIFSENLENIEVIYDIYKYDSINDPMKIIDNTFFKLEKMVCEIQYNGEETIDNHYRMTYNHPINSLAVNIPKKFENSVIMKLTDNYDLKLTPSYRIGEFVVYDFPYINFSKVCYAKFVIDHENFTTLENFKIFAFNAQPMRSMSGLSGLMFTK